jgi:hypothetical protein
MPEHFDNAEQLQERLAELLVKGALYRNFVYKGNECHFESRSARYGRLPTQLKMYCDNKKCEQETWWDVNDSRVYFHVAFIHDRDYTCRNCGKNCAYYHFIWQENKNGNIFLKVGQYPPLAIEPSPQLTKALGTEDADLYKKALIDANFNHGLGAIAYFRRVLENKVNALLDLIAEAARNAQFGTDDLLQIDKIKKSHRVEEKIQFASKILPAHLKPGGHDPLDKLYTAASGGLHGESDDQCLVIFKEGKFVFEYLFKNLTVSNEEAREYVKRLSMPLKAKAEPPERNRA